MKKTLYLFLALLLPALLFVFLKYAGRNEFNIPVYYEEGIEKLSSECNVAYGFPYKVADTVWQFLDVVQHRANIVVFAENGTDVDRFKSKMRDEFDMEYLAIIDPCHPSGDSMDCARLEKCIFLVTKPWEAVLVDGQGQIRGYYGLQTREEEDRLRVELKILLKQY